MHGINSQQLPGIGRRAEKVSTPSPFPGKNQRGAEWGADMRKKKEEELLPLLFSDDEGIRELVPGAKGYF